MEKLKWFQLERKIREHNKAHNIDKAYSDTGYLKCAIVFDSQLFIKKFPEDKRTYVFRSDEPYFIDGVYAHAINGKCLGDSTRMRVDYEVSVFSPWKIEYCYFID